MTVCVHHWDSFTRQPGKGNPAGIVLHADGLASTEMQAIALAIGFNDTAFISRSRSADFRIRYFAPRREVELCGHATIAAFAALHRQRLLPGDTHRATYRLETQRAILPIGVEAVSGDSPLIVMTQGISQFARFNGSRDAVAHAIGIDVTELHAALPILYGSTGRWTLVVPLKDLQTMQHIRPSPEDFGAALTEMPDASIHPFCLQTIDPHAGMHARHFSAPSSGTLEDAVTGTASGVLGAYYRRFIAAPGEVPQPLLIEQGYEMGREGTVQVWADVLPDSQDYAVRIAGTACFVKDVQVDLP